MLNNQLSSMIFSVNEMSGVCYYFPLNKQWYILNVVYKHDFEDDH